MRFGARVSKGNISRILDVENRCSEQIISELAYNIKALVCTLDWMALLSGKGAVGGMVTVLSLRIFGLMYHVIMERLGKRKASFQRV